MHSLTALYSDVTKVSLARTAQKEHQKLSVLRTADISKYIWIAPILVNVIFYFSYCLYFGENSYVEMIFDGVLRVSNETYK